MVSSVNSHTNATRIGWHLWEIDLRFAPGGEVSVTCFQISAKNNHFTEMCCGSEAGSYLRRIDSCITQLKAQGPSRTCNESKEEEGVSVTCSQISAKRPTSDPPKVRRRSESMPNRCDRQFVANWTPQTPLVRVLGLGLGLGFVL